MARPGLLLVTMQPAPGLPAAQFHEWYNNEHGPTRLRLPVIFANGLRYAAADGLTPSYVAIYDVRDMDLLATPTYTDLRANRSAREAATIGQVQVLRHLLVQRLVRQAVDFVAPEALPGTAAHGRLLVHEDVTAADTSDVDAALCWYDDHLSLLSEASGWLRSRVYTVEPGDSAGSGSHLHVVHEFAATGGVDGSSYAAATAKNTANIAETRQRKYALFYVFGPAPRDLASLALLSPAQSFVSSDGRTSTTAGPDAVIRSYVTLTDGLSLPYTLEGSVAADAPTIAFCNSLLTSAHMWDAFVAILRHERPQYRLLRYDQRGRHAIPTPQPATMEQLADDLAALLDALRIPQLHAVIGVSQGGATALQFGLRHATRTEKLVACDFNIASSAGNTAAWQERIRVAEAPDNGMATLASQTVGRWFDAHTLAHKPAAVEEMIVMVAANAIDGFRYGCQALWKYDLHAAAPTLAPKALLVAGEGDGKGALARAMDGFRSSVGPTGAELRIVPNAGHLPMFEDAEGFWGAIKDFV